MAKTSKKVAPKKKAAAKTSTPAKKSARVKEAAMPPAASTATPHLAREQLPIPDPKHVA